MSDPLTFFVTIKRTDRLLFMCCSVFTLMSVLITLSAENLLLINAIPIGLLSLALLTFLTIGNPSSNFRAGLICVDVSILNIVLPNVLTLGFKKVLMIVN